MTAVKQGGYDTSMDDPDESIVIRAPARPLDAEVEAKLRSALGKCPDIGFAHLVEVEVSGRDEEPALALFAWLTPQGMGSLRASLTLVSEIVAGVLPEGRFLDVLILNSAPELLDRVESAGCLLVECDPQERLRALEAAATGGSDEPTDGGRGWWPF
jgi:hypothetical protein